MIIEYQPYYRDGSACSDTVVGQRLGLVGQPIHLDDGTILRAAEIEPSGGGPVKTVLIKVTEEEALL